MKNDRKIGPFLTTILIYEDFKVKPFEDEMVYSYDLWSAILF